MTDDGPHNDDPDGIALLRATLLDAGYTPAAVRDALATEVASGRDAAELPLYLRMLPDGEPLSALIKLFLLGLPVTEADAERALAPLTLPPLEAMGVLRRSGSSVKAGLELVPSEEMLIACDPFRDELARPDHVLGVSPPARVLAWLTVRKHVERVLDLGTGNGHQALLAARHADSVIGVDINPRALRFAAFNAVLNGTRRIELREGNLFEPVEGIEFDLIVSNPPYVISPENGIAYRDGGLRGDAFCERLVRSLPAYLRHDGIAQVLVSWLHARDEDWALPVRRWVEGNGCDVILLRYAVHEPLNYAAGWNRPYRGDARRYGAALDRWSDYFTELGVEAISWGALMLRRREGQNWFWAYHPPSDRITGASDQMLRLLRGQDYLSEAGEAELLRAALSLVEEHRLEQTIRLRDGDELIERNLLRLESGLRFEVSIDASTERVLALLDGRRSLENILAEVAETAHATPRAFVLAALPVIRRLIELGFVVPPDGTPG